MPLLLITRGLPGSGKTTAAVEWVAESPAARARVNRDSIRVMLHGRRLGTRDQENQVTAVAAPAVRKLLRLGLDVVCDDTHLNPRLVEQARTLADQVGADFEVWDFTAVPMEVCVERDSRRTGNEHVGEDVIRGMWRKYLAPRTAAS